jgi:hypothetical protein
MTSRKHGIHGWHKYRNGYNFIRTIVPGEQPNKTNKQIHVFADASKDAYAAVAYMRCESNGKVTVRFIQAKLRVGPVKAAHTIPRMELLAIELGIQLVKKIYKTFKVETHNIYIWTDSRACHDWLRIEARALQVFIKKQSTESQTVLETGASQMKAWCIEPGRLSDERNLSSPTENGQALAARTRLPPRTSRNLARPTRAAGRIDSRSSSRNNTGNETGKDKIRKNTNHANLPSKSPTGNRPLLRTNDTKHH